jgi:hypothetical protein
MTPFALAADAALAEMLCFATDMLLVSPQSLPRPSAAHLCPSPPPATSPHATPSVPLPQRRQSTPGTCWRSWASLL